MSLQNLLGISLDPITPSRETVSRLMAAVDRHLNDARQHQVSAETRFVCAYTAIRMLADVGLHANGFRTLTSKPGHHQTAIQTLPLTVGASPNVVRILDGLRKQRHVTEYCGDLIPESAALECLQQAQALQTLLKQWLNANHPELVAS